MTGTDTVRALSPAEGGAAALPWAVAAWDQVRRLAACRPDPLRSSGRRDGWPTAIGLGGEEGCSHRCGSQAGDQAEDDRVCGRSSYD